MELQESAMVSDLALTKEVVKILKTSFDTNLPKPLSGFVSSSSTGGYWVAMYKAYFDAYGFESEVRYMGVKRGSLDHVWLRVKAIDGYIELERDLYYDKREETVNGYVLALKDTFIEDLGVDPFIGKLTVEELYPLFVSQSFLQVPSEMFLDMLCCATELALPSSERITEIGDLCRKYRISKHLENCLLGVGTRADEEYLAKNRSKTPQ